MKRGAMIIFLCALCFAVSAAEGTGISVSGRYFLPGTRVGVKAVSEDDATGSITVALFKGGSALEEHGVTVNGGEVSFTAPDIQGAYELRVTDGGNGDIQAKKVYVHYILINKMAFHPGEVIKLWYSAMRPELEEGAWVGMFEGDAPEMDGEHVREIMLAEDFMNLNSEDIMEFDAPQELGKYQFRAYTSMDPDGYEISRVVFEVLPLDEKTALRSDKGKYAAGSTAMVTYKTNVNLLSGAWIAVVSPGVPHGLSKESAEYNNDYHLPYAYLDHETREGVVDIEIPGKPGKYEFRMFNSNDDDGRELASFAFEVIW